MALLRPEHHWPSSSTVECSTMRMCPCKRRPLWAHTVTDVSVYKLLMRLFHIGNFCFWVPFLKQLLLRNCAVDFVEICNVYVGKMIIEAAKRIFNSDKICRSYRNLNFGVTFFGTQCICHRPSVCLSVVCTVRALYSGDWNFRQCFYAIWYLGHLRPFDKNFTEIDPGKPLRLGS